MQHRQSVLRACALTALTAIAALGQGNALAAAASPHSEPGKPGSPATQSASPQAEPAPDPLAEANFALLALAGVGALTFISRRR